jgi:GT2 family glycosyltransferase
MFSRMPVPGVAWQTIHYLLGFERLGCEVHYVETHGRTPSMLMSDPDDDPTALAVGVIEPLMRRFGLAGRWAYVPLHGDPEVRGMSRRELDRVYAEADVLLNLHGGTAPLPELTAGDRLVYLETDPVELQVELHERLAVTEEFLDAHCAFFSFAENLGAADCGLPATERYPFHPTRQPVLLDQWAADDPPAGDAFTTIGNWRQPWRNVEFRGETYTWSKHLEFQKVIDLPRRVSSPLELALSSYTDDDLRLLGEHGWRVRPAHEVTRDVDSYRAYVRSSRGELTVAKDQNVRLRTGWFSDRSATYLAAGRPVVTQDTGFGSVLPTGEGLFAFADADEAAAALEAVAADPARHARAAREIAWKWFAAKRVLAELLDVVGVSVPAERRAAPRPAAALPDDLDLRPVSRWPTRLPDATVRAVLDRPVPVPAPARVLAEPKVSVVIPTHDNLVFLRLCLESLLANAGALALEVVVVDNGSGDGTADYLRRLGPQVRPIVNAENRGFAAAINQGIAAARGDAIVLLNDDTVVPPEALERLVAHLDDPAVGLVGASSNRAGNEAEVPDADYATYRELLGYAAGEVGAGLLDVRTVALFCAALPRRVVDAVGVLDERFGRGLFEDDDYAERVRRAGLRVAVATDAFVHHFGQASIGKLAQNDEYGPLFHGNRRRFERKWGVEWSSHERRPNPGYDHLSRRVRDLVATAVPEAETVAVVTRGDDELLELGDRRGQHFPHDDAGRYAGHHPADSDAAMHALRDACREGTAYLVVPQTAFWWFEHYREFGAALHARCPVVAADDDTAVIFDVRQLQETK